MPTAAELLQCMGVGGCGCPISSRMSGNITACLQLKKRAPSSASVAKETTKRKITHGVKNARSRAGGHFFLSNDENFPPNNGAILTNATIIKAVMSSAAEAKLGALYINAKDAVYLRQILDEMGHPQPKTPIQTDNTTAEGVINNKIQPKRTKAMDMRFHWLRNRESQDQFRIY